MSIVPSDHNAPAKPSPLHNVVHDRLAALSALPKTNETLLNMLRLLAKWRSAMIVNTILKLNGPYVQSGPFQGMYYGGAASEGSGSARLLGVYEAALHPVIEAIIAHGYAQVLDVGCAEGYYAVGLARRMPQARIIARDTSAAAQQNCRELARANETDARIEIGGAVAHSHFDICAQAETVVICDIEGAEAELLNPTLAKGLLSADILVEVHDCFSPNLSQQIAQRFAASHDVQIIHRSLSPDPLPESFNSFSDLDRLIALWEWRIGPTPWLWMTRKVASHGETNFEKGNSAS
jgi:hypothetical protein